MDFLMRFKQIGRLIESIELRFGHSNMKESYLVEARLRRRTPGESFRDLVQAIIEDLYRRVYPSNSEVLQEIAFEHFLMLVKNLKISGLQFDVQNLRHFRKQ